MIQLFYWLAGVRGDDDGIRINNLMQVHSVITSTYLEVDMNNR